MDAETKAKEVNRLKRKAREVINHLTEQTMVRNVSRDEIRRAVQSAYVDLDWLPGISIRQRVFTSLRLFRDVRMELKQIFDSEDSFAISMDEATVTYQTICRMHIMAAITHADMTIEESLLGMDRFPHNIDL